MILKEILSIQNIQTLLLSGFTNWKQYGEVFVDQDNDLTIFNYTQGCMYSTRWNFFERVSRGLIINNKTGEIVARPFDKFFNWLENGEKASGYIVNITEKWDGSLGILYRKNNGYKIATRGRFDSDQAIWATEFLNKNYVLSDLDNNITLLFEVIYPENRVVVDYKEFEGLILLAARNRFNGDYCPFFPDVYNLSQLYGFKIPNIYNFNNIDEIMEAKQKLDINQEGWVVEFSSGQRFKFKGDRYLELHKLIMQLSFKHTVEAYANNTIDYIRSQIPEEFLEEFNSWCIQIENKVKEIHEKVEQLFLIAPKEVRKDFAIWANKNASEYSIYLFKRLDNCNYDDIIYKKAFDNYVENEERT
jgi:RNA ligase